MVVTIKNKVLHKSIQKKLDNLTTKQLNLIKKGKLIEANRMDSTIDKLYSDNYYKMYKVVRNK